MDAGRWVFAWIAASSLPGVELSRSGERLFLERCEQLTIGLLPVARHVLAAQAGDVVAFDVRRLLLEVEKKP